MESQSLPAYQRRTKAADALIAGAYLAGTNTRRVRRALKAVSRGSRQGCGQHRTWRKVKGDWDAWNARSLTDEPIIRLILDGTVVRVRLDKKATSISLLVALGVRADGQRCCCDQNMGGESEAAWRALLDDLVKRGLKTPELVIVDGAPGLEKALAALWSDVPVQRCTVHSTAICWPMRTERLHEKSQTTTRHDLCRERKQEVESETKSFHPQMRLKCRAVADSLEEARRQACSPSRAFRQASGNRSARRTQSNACMKSSSAGSRRKPCSPAPKPPPCCSGADASGQITMRKVDGWQSLAESCRSNH